MKKIKFTDLYSLIEEKSKIKSKINTLIKNSQFIGGDEVINFEKNFKDFVKTNYCVSVGNGTDALEIAIKSLKLEPNSEIILPVNTWISSAESIVSNNCKPIFCDVDLNDYSICLNDLKKKISRKTKCIMVVHLYGIPSNMNKIKEMIKGKNIKIIEDCAQAHGAKIGKKHVGSFSDVATFSFFPGKNLGAFGDAGAIVTNSKSIYNYCMRARNHGAMNKYDHKFSGRNSRLDSLNAAVLNIKLKNYNKVMKKRNHLSELYFKGLKNLKGLSLFKLNKKNTHSFHQFVIRTNKRDKLLKYLKKNKIQTMIHYPYMLNELKFFGNQKINNAKNLGKKILSLPISEEHSSKEIKIVINKIQKFFQNKINNKHL